MQGFCITVCFAFMLSICTLPASATAIIYNVNLTGAKEVPGPGDPDASAIGTLKLDNGTGSGTTGSVTLSLTLANLDFPLTNYHIHTGATGVAGSPLIDLGNPETLRSGSTLSGTVSGLSAANITTVQANPAGFYFNIHNGIFTGGAVRDQVPEPSALALLACGAGALLARRRRRPRAA